MRRRHAAPDDALWCELCALRNLLHALSRRSFSGRDRIDTNARPARQAGDVVLARFSRGHSRDVVGFIRPLGRQGGPEPLFLYGPKGAKKVLATALQLGVERVPFPVEIVEVKAGDSVTRDGGGTARDGYDIFAFPTEHGERE